MSFTCLTKPTLRIFSQRLNGLSEMSTRRWGSMEVGDMLEHLIQLTRVSLGEIQVEDRSTVLTRSFVSYFFFRWVPWPKGKLKTFQFMLPPPQGRIEEQKARLQAAMERFVNALDSDPGFKTVSPLLGATTLKRWSIVHGKHMDHHFKQFGV